MEYVKKWEDAEKKATADFIVAKEKMLEELPGKLAEKNNELRHVQDELLQMGFDPENPDNIPVSVESKDKNDKERLRYTTLLEEYNTLINELCKLQGDQFMIQENRFN